MRSFGRHIASFFLSAALLVTPVVPAAAAPPAQASTAPSADGWATLSMLTAGGMPALAGAAAAAAQPVDAPPPARSYGIGPLPLPVIAVWLGVIALDIYLLTRNDHHHHVPNSPA